MKQQNSETSPIFYGLGIAPKLLEILERNHYTTPTPIQLKSIPIGVEGKDIIGIAQTGTGKTLAFSVPLIQRLVQVQGRGLIILPTRELAIQVDETIQKIGRPVGLRTAVLIGGASMGLQMNALRHNPHIIIATPGRLIDHLEQRTVDLKSVKILVLDEADRMLDMGFAPQIKRILESVPSDRQTMLFSATMPSEIVTIATKHMKLPVRVEIARAGTTAEKVAQELFVVPKDAKTRLLDKLLSEYRGTILVFSRTKHGAKKITRDIRGMGHTAAEIHANRSLSQRRDALEGFKTGKYRVLVATDIAARGIDVKNIEVVINYDLPDNAEDYVHRIGRTGRAGHEGRAISFATPDQASDVRQIERLIRSPLPRKALPELPPKRASVPEAEDRFERRESSPRGYSSHRSPRVHADFSNPDENRNPFARSTGGNFQRRRKPTGQPGGRSSGHPGSGQRRGGFGRQPHQGGGRRGSR